MYYVLFSKISSEYAFNVLICLFICKIKDRRLYGRLWLIKTRLINCPVTIQITYLYIY